MYFLPVGIDIEDQQILIIGGGKVGLHKVEGLERFTRNIKVLAPVVIDEIRRREWIDIVEKHYEPADLQGHLLVYAATSDHGLNTRIRDDARNYRCLVNVVDMPANCDFISPAIFKHDSMSVAVSSNGENVYASIQWRNEIQKLVENGTITPVHPKHIYRGSGSTDQETE
jgi:precorrin-2 dehydrogenase / sirohydrochlorin ferrochelatase